MTKGRSPDDLLSGLGGIKGVRLGKGIVGKTGYIAIFNVLAWIAIIWKLGDNLTLDGMLVLVGACVTCFSVWSIKASFKFAEDNPGIALLEGAEVIAYKQMEIAAAQQQGSDLKVIDQNKRGSLSKQDALK